MPTARDRFALGDVNGILYAVGGQNYSGDNLTTVESYNPTTNSWTTGLPALPTGREDLAVASVNGLLYAIGGGNGANALGTVEAYSPTTNSWITGLASMPTARCNLSVGVVNGIIYAVGGDDGSQNPMATVEAYDPVADKWSSKSSMPVPLSQFPMAVLNGLLYVSGGDPNTGFTTSVGVTNLTESYNPGSDSWTPGLAVIPTPVETGAGGTLNGLFYVTGGASNGPSPAIMNGVQAYDPSANSWTVESPMTDVQAAGGGDAVNGVFYSIGGWSGGAFMNANQVGKSACTPTITPTPTATLSPTVTFTPTVTSSPTVTLSPTPTPTATLSPTVTFTPTATSSPTVTLSPTPTLANLASPGDFFIYPSPAKGSQATVSYNVAQSGTVDLRVWNEKAELVAHVTDEKTAGVQETPFSISGFVSGVYFYSLTLTYGSGQVENLGPKKFVILH